MNIWTLKDWLVLVVVVVGLTAITWGTLTVGRVIYDDWSFLHAVRILNEEQRLQQLRQTSQPQPPKPGP